MVTFMVMVKQSKDKIEGLGSHKFLVPPRTGEYITMNDKEGIGQAYRVTAVIHPLDVSQHAGDLILEHVGTDVDLRMSF